MSRKKKTKIKSNLALDLFALPAVVIWAELILHLALKLELKYAIVWVLFDISFGAVLTAVISLFKYKTGGRIIAWTSAVVTLFYVIEFEAKKILATFYPFSILGTAAENKLSDYFSAVVSTVFKTFGWILLFFAPALLLILFFNRGGKPKGYKRKTILILSLILAIITQLLGIIFVNIIPWHSDVNPKNLYYSTGDYDSQVEMLGLKTMLRLDVKYTILGREQKGEEPVIDDPDVPEEPEIDISKNIIGIDWAAVQNASSNSDIKSLAQYFGSIKGTSKNEWTGKFKDYNVIFLSLEGFSGYAISEKYTPTIYKLVHEGFYCKNFYTALHYTSTSGGECQNLLGLYPENNRITMRETGVKKTNTYFSLASILDDYGYISYGFHNNGDMYGREASHENLGYDWYYIDYNGNYKPNNDHCIDWEGSKDVNEGKLRWPQRDSFMMEHTTKYYIDNTEPFNVYYMTISGHMPYSWNWMATPYKDALKDSGYSDNTNAYLPSCMEVDKAFSTLLAQLEAAGKLENTLIVASPDHIPYFNPSELEELAGQEFAEGNALENINERNINFEVYHSACIIWSAAMEQPVEVNKVCCQVDLLPTVLNLLGVEYDSRVLGGTDINSDSEGLVVFSSRCWKSDMGSYNSFNQKFTFNEGVNLSESAKESYIARMKNLATNRLSITKKILNSDFYDYVYTSDKFLLAEKSEAPFGEDRFVLRGIYRKLF